MNYWWLNICSWGLCLDMMSLRRTDNKPPTLSEATEAIKRIFRHIMFINPLFSLCFNGMLSLLLLLLQPCFPTDTIKVSSNVIDLNCTHTHCTDGSYSNAYYNLKNQQVLRKYELTITWNCVPLLLEGTRLTAEFLLHAGVRVTWESSVSSGDSQAGLISHLAALSSLHRGNRWGVDIISSHVHLHILCYPGATHWHCKDRH